MSGERLEIECRDGYIVVDGCEYYDHGDYVLDLVTAIRQQARDIDLLNHMLADQRIVIEDLEHRRGKVCDENDQLRAELAAAVAERDWLLKLRDTCEHCNGTGDVHTPTGEWDGTCDCVYAQNNKLRAFKAVVDAAPTITYIYKFPYLGGFVWRHSQLEFNGARAVDSMELIARPAKDQT